MAKKLFQKISKNQVARFIFSVGVGFIVDNIAFYILFRHLLINKTYNIFNHPVNNYSIAFSISYSLGVLANFLMTRYFVFSESKLAPYKQFMRFMTVAFIGYFANFGVINILIQVFGIYPPLARPLAMLSLFFASYFVHKLFSFSLSLRHHAVHPDHK